LPDEMTQTAAHMRSQKDSTFKRGAYDE